MSDNNENKINNDLAFGKQNYILIDAGTALAIIGYFLISELGILENSFIKFYVFRKNLTFFFYISSENISHDQAFVTFWW